MDPLLPAERFLDALRLCGENNRYWKSPPREIGTKAGVVLEKSPFEVDGASGVESTVNALEDVNPGHSNTVA